jgi:hypothetical protein
LGTHVNVEKFSSYLNYIYTIDLKRNCYGLMPILIEYLPSGEWNGKEVVKGK